MQAKPRGFWQPKERVLRWAFKKVAPGESVRAVVVFGAGTAAARGSHANLRFMGPPEETLSGIALDSGPDEGVLCDSSALLIGAATVDL